MFNSWFCRLPPVWSCVLTNVKTTHCLCFTLLMWFWCTSQLYLEWFCVQGVNVSDLIWAVRSLSIKHFHHCILHYNMQTKAAASLLSTAVLMISTCCYRERERRQGEEGPACRHNMADTELDLRSLQILRAHFLSDFFCSGSVADQWKYPILPIDLPKNLRWPNFSLYLFISPFPKHLLGQTEPRAGP